MSSKFDEIDKKLSFLALTIKKVEGFRLFCRISADFLKTDTERAASKYLRPIKSIFMFYVSVIPLIHKRRKIDLLLVYTG